MAATFSSVQTASGGAQNTVASRAVTLSATTQGNLVIVGAVVLGTTDTLSSVTDDATGGANTYVVLSGIADPSGQKLFLAYGFQVHGGATTITLTYSGATAGNNKREYASEYSGFSASANNTIVFDTSSTGSGTGTSGSVSTLTPARAGNLIIATTLINAGGFSAGTNYTAYGAHSSGGVQGQHRLASGTSETAPFSLNSSEWAERAASFNSGLDITISETAGVPEESISISIDASISETAGVPVESVSLKSGFGNTGKSSSSWTNTQKS